MKKLTTILLSVLITQLSFGQNENEVGYLDNFYSDTKIFLTDGFSYFTYPLTMDNSQWITTAGIGLSAYLLIQNDAYIQERIGRKNSKRLDNKVWTLFENYGVIEYAELASIATYSVGYISNNDDVRVLGRMLFQSLTYSGLTAMFIRMIAGRKRPPYTDDHLMFTGFTVNNSFQSFPSGHTTVAFAFSTVLAEYFDTPWSRIGFYGIAGIAATERLLNNDHWFSDVTLGALLGIAGGFHVINQEINRTKNKTSKNKISIIPTFNGIRFQYRLN